MTALQIPIWTESQRRVARPVPKKVTEAVYWGMVHDPVILVIDICEPRVIRKTGSHAAHGNQKGRHTGAEVSVPPDWFPCGAWEPERPVHGSGSFRAARLVPMRRGGTRIRERESRAVPAIRK